MHILVIDFQLEGISVGEFYEICHELSQIWAQIPGLTSKVWLADPETSTYGGIYIWESKEAMHDFLRSELFDAIAHNQNFVNPTAKDYGVIEAPTRVTRGFTATPA